MSSLIDYIVHFDGYPLQAYLLDNIDFIGYIASCYLVMVGKGDRILRWWNKNKNSSKAPQADGGASAPLQNGQAKAAAAALKSCHTAAFFYHAVMCFVCAALSCLLVPAMAQSILRNSFFDTMCIWDDYRTLKGYVGFALGGAVMVKVAEQLDTFFLVLRDYITSSPEQEKRQPRRVTPSHWWFQVLVALYFWHTYSIGTSCFAMLATWSLIISAVRNLLYMQQDSAQARLQTAAAAKLAGTVAALDIAECVGCSLLSLYASYMNYTNERGCMTVQANVRMALVLYVTEVVLRVREMLAAVAERDTGKKKQ
ncbi:putative mitochondrial fatty acid elongase [Leptomonas pyrrhocoris]|uniref:Elongation of fatty acids protein n=1 Tax=Leptomonas pyrrhocoris TaxID=157538 RepID=A0A0M9FWC3_LEPPY|nr:putative mitochondrial fatty acid elongase [Leptomonas pyrrhocoris]XP_015655674.1 putative mitochondrial fatty acid elongase [Leptomonas pyrrhocoris]XP_015655675.1 putative mitochondrial fatty acid elongase [Leptomonas pyrrhocoris]KPA77234.1 putative mitochondrial fatty acid elongase [Leptomonas pyrrhocoris]KPA77235.1 putative mitochondrial fatty acid elongase [Leptomonas pyrrhocoris]KPA77236.1 putative mitochondrial fatty acid elongase [Leptomonas pyrrhocoris]|eukprot:XP_015655673.1 putative mitochondrial fatty acid elongase [Leptomonas pyrrhocoris]